MKKVNTIVGYYNDAVKLFNPDALCDPMVDELIIQAALQMVEEDLREYLASVNLNRHFDTSVFDYPSADERRKRDKELLDKISGGR